jgi:uncharacterized protein YdeI (BOF family)
MLGGIVERITVQSLLALAVVGSITIAAAASPVIGVARTHGQFRADNAQGTGNATLFNGTRIETAEATSQLHLNGGTRVILASNSRGRVYQDRIVLERGTGQVEGSVYPIEAAALKIVPDSAGAKALVSVDKQNKVHVTALNGNLKVGTASGILVATLMPGKALSFDPRQAGAAAPTTLTGCLEARAGRFVVRDETANVTYEVQGAGLSGETGNRVEITGTIVPGAQAAGGASQMLRVTNVRQLSKGCLPGGAGAAAGGAAAGAGAAAGTGAATATAVVAGIVVAGAAAGTVVAIVLTRDDAS